MLNLIIKAIQEFVDVEESEINEDTNFIQDLHLTSYDIVSMIGKLEEDLGVEIPDSDIRDLETVGDLIAYIKEQII